MSDVGLLSESTQTEEEGLKVEDLKRDDLKVDAAVEVGVHGMSLPYRLSSEAREILPSF